MKRSVNFSAPRRHFNTMLAHFDEPMPDVPEWYKRTVDAIEKLRQLARDPNRDRIFREGLFEMAGLADLWKGRKFNSGAYLFEVLWQMWDAGYTKMSGIYATKPDTDERVNMHRTYVADCMRAIIRAMQE